MLAGHLCSQARRVGSSGPDLLAMSGEDRILQEKDTQKRKRFLVEIDVPPCDQDAPAFSAETGHGVAVFGLVDKAIPVEVLGVLAVLAYSSRRVDAQSCFHELHGGRKEQRDGWLIFVGLRSLVRISSFTGKRARCRTQSSKSEP